MASRAAKYGEGLGASLSKWLGSGDYALDSNSIVDRFRSSGQIPAMHSSNQSVIIRHKEYVGDVVSSSSANTFNVFNSYALNPGLSGSFPWLSSIASNYQEYTWKGVVYEFVSTSADAIASSTNTALGSVMMFTNYKSTSALPVNKLQVLNEYFSCDNKPSESFCHPIECNPAENPYNVQYIRTGAVPSGEDQKTYDIGVFAVATTGFQGTSVVCGELWVSYEVELRKPIIPIPEPGGTSPGGYAHFFASTAVTTSAYFGTSQTVAGTFSAAVLTGFVIAATTITFPIGWYGNVMVFMTWVGGSTAVTVPTVTGTTNIATVKGFINDTVVNVDNTGTTATRLFTCGTWSITNPNINAVLTLSGGTLPTSVTGMDLYVIPMAVVSPV
jgi:hypothetical protein